MWGTQVDLTYNEVSHAWPQCEGGACWEVALCRMLDATTLTVVRFLRQYPLGRLVVLAYAVFIHLFVYTLIHHLQQQALHSERPGFHLDDNQWGWHWILVVRLFMYFSLAIIPWQLPATWPQRFTWGKFCFSRDTFVEHGLLSTAINFLSKLCAVSFSFREAEIKESEPVLPAIRHVCLTRVSLLAVGASCLHHFAKVYNRAKLLELFCIKSKLYPRSLPLCSRIALRRISTTEESSSLIFKLGPSSNLFCVHFYQNL